MINSLLFLKGFTEMDKISFKERVRQTVITCSKKYKNNFVDYDYLVKNTTKIKSMTNREFYSYGNDGKYTPDNLLFSNNLITRISNNEANLCLDSTMSNDVIDLCRKNNLYTITPSTVKQFFTNRKL